MIEMKQICKKILILLLIVSITITGCFPNNIKKKELSFKGLDDEKLQDYVIDTIYSGVNSNFTSDDYTVDEVVTTYISKEYIEEVNYNSKSNIYFGYTLEELINKFNGVKYVFEVGEDNKTRVTEFKDYEDTYRKMLKNVAIGSGVILVCATVSIASSGTAVSIVFAASAKLATEFAVSSAALSGIISSAIEYYKTGDIQKSLEKGGLEASESFKWGAILGSVSGGISETITQLDAAKKIKSMNVVERGARSELKAYKKYGGREQVSYLNGKEVEISTIGASRPDLVRIKNGKLEALEVKNYNLNSETSIENLYRELKRQVSSRVKNLPKGSTQRIVLDIQGRNYSKKTLKEVIKGIQNACEESYHKIPVDIMS